MKTLLVIFVLCANVALSQSVPTIEVVKSDTIGGKVFQVVTLKDVDHPEASLSIAEFQRKFCADGFQFASMEEFTFATQLYDSTLRAFFTDPPESPLQPKIAVYSKKNHKWEIKGTEQFWSPMCQVVRVKNI